MNFRIADTFTASLARLTGDEQKAVKTTAFDLRARDRLFVSGVDPVSEFWRTCLMSDESKTARARN